MRDLADLAEPSEYLTASLRNFILNFWHSFDIWILAFELLLIVFSNLFQYLFRGGKGAGRFPVKKDMGVPVHG